MKYISFLCVVCFLAGCSSYPYKVSELALDPSTGLPLQQPNGSYIVIDTRKSQKTIQIEQKLAFINSQVSSTSVSNSKCDIVPPNSAADSLWVSYYMTKAVCGASMSTSDLYAIQGLPDTVSGRMFLETERTAREALKYDFNTKQMWANLGLGIAGLAVDIYEIENSPGDLGSGGTYIRGGVTVNQTNSNSGGSDSEGENGSTSQTRQIANTVFGDAETVRVSDQARNASSRSLQQEPSATGGLVSDSDVKGFIPVDENNASIDFDDRDSVGTFEF